MFETSQPNNVWPAETLGELINQAHTNRLSEGRMSGLASAMTSELDDLSDNIKHNLGLRGPDVRLDEAEQLLNKLGEMGNAVAVFPGENLDEERPFVVGDSSRRMDGVLVVLGQYPFQKDLHHEDVRPFFVQPGFQDGQWDVEEIESTYIDLIDRFTAADPTETATEEDESS